MAVADRFKTLIGWTEPSSTSQQLFESHSASVTARLKAAFSVVKLLVIGSHSRGTAVANISDIDLLLVVRREEVTRADSLVSSNTVLGNVRHRRR
jgi:predicted nucleotidyltransferase